MNQLNISAGLIYDNYPALCTALGAQTLTGLAKINQLEEWKLYFNYQKRGRKYHILEIYPQDRQAVLEYNYCMTKLLRVTLLEFLKPLIAVQVSTIPDSDATTPGIISVERNNLMLLLGMVNQTFIDERYTKQEGSNAEFMRSLRSRNFQDIDAILKDLHKDKVLIASEGFIIETKQFAKRAASQEEAVEIFNTYHKVLEEFELQNEGELCIRQDLVKIFYKEVNHRLREQFGITHHSKSYTFASSQYLIERYTEKMDKYLLDRISRLAAINRKVCERMFKTAQRVFTEFKVNENKFRGGTLSESDKWNKQYRENYLEEQEELIKKYIKQTKQELQFLEEPLNLEHLTEDN